MDADKLSGTADARVWARTFVEYNERYGPFDEETILGWFANAIMCGWDHHAQSIQHGEPEADPDSLESRRMTHDSSVK